MIGKRERRVWVAAAVVAIIATVGLAASQLRWIDALHTGQAEWQRAAAQEAGGRVADSLQQHLARVQAEWFEVWAAGAGDPQTLAAHLDTTAPDPWGWLGPPRVIQTSGVERFDPTQQTFHPEADPQWEAWSEAVASVSAEGRVVVPVDPPALVLPWPDGATPRCVAWPLDMARIDSLARREWASVAPAPLRDALAPAIRPADDRSTAEVRIPLGLQPALELETAVAGPGRKVVRLVTGEGEESIVEMREDPAPVPTRMELAPAGNWELVLLPEGETLASRAARQRWRHLLQAAATTLLFALGLVLLGVLVRRQRRLATDRIAFLAGITHEVRTPLAVLTTAADNLSDGVVTDPGHAREYGETIRRETRRLRRLTDAALQLAGAEGPPPPRELLDPEALLHEAVLRAAPGIPVEVEGPLPAGRGNRDDLLGALENLLHNARLHGEDPVRASVHATAHGLEFRVHDAGRRLSDADLEALFEPFRRGAHAAASQTPGSGLGLAIGRRTARAHGGDLDARVDGTGTTFRLRIPVEDDG